MGAGLDGGAQTVNGRLLLDMDEALRLIARSDGDAKEIAAQTLERIANG